MPAQKRRTDGPLSDVQKQILSLLADGLSQREIGKQLGSSQSYVSAEACLAANRMGVTSTAAAVARYSSYLANLKAAQSIRCSQTLIRPTDQDIHVNHVLEDLACLLERRAQNLLPA